MSNRIYIVMAQGRVMQAFYDRSKADSMAKANGGYVVETELK